MIEHSTEIDKLSAAIHAAQKNLAGVYKNGKNPHFKNKYATLETVIDTIKVPLNDQGLAFVQTPGAMHGDTVEITTMLMHTSGQWLRSTLHIPLGPKRDPQGCGSAITYGCRYSLMAILGVPPTDEAPMPTHHGQDDDAEGAMGRNSRPTEAAPKAREPDHQLNELHGIDPPKPAKWSVKDVVGPNATPMQIAAARKARGEELKAKYAAIKDDQFGKVREALNHARGNLGRLCEFTTWLAPKNIPLAWHKAALDLWSVEFSEFVASECERPSHCLGFLAEHEATLQGLPGEYGNTAFAMIARVKAEIEAMETATLEAAE